MKVMYIKRKIACNYLLNQYRNAKKYLELCLNNNLCVERIDDICNRVKRAGIAYAQAKYCFFEENGIYENGIYSEDFIGTLNDDNIVTCFAEYKNFIDKMENYIKQTVNNSKN